MDRVDAWDTLRTLLNEWDPIGVADIVEDEYDCLIGPILAKLNAGVTRAEVEEFLWSELQDHSGLDPRLQGVDRVADRLVAWWAEVANAETEVG